MDHVGLGLDLGEGPGGEAVLVPASLVYLDFYTGPRAAHPPTNALQYAGIAAGPTPVDAVRSGLEELFERDATALWWATGAPATRITAAEQVTGRLDDPEAGTRTVRLWLLPSPVDAPVVAAFVEDHARRMVAFGTACRADPVAAATKAVVEAFAVLAITMDLADPGSDTWRAVESGDIPRHLYRPFRADRGYRDAFAPDWRNLTDLPPVAQLYLDPRMHGAPLDRLRDDDTPAVALADVPAIPGTGEDVCREYLRRLHAAGLDAVGVDLTTGDVRAAGLHVVRVVVPGLLNNAAAAFPLLGGERLYRVPVERGWVRGPITADTLVPHPVPLA
jgi:ribosomal protein S12 methylthiotransferase accessory factor